MKKVLYVLLLCLLSLAVFAQDSTAPAATTSADLNLDEADPTKIGADSAEQKLKEISVEKYESEGTWIVNMSADEGVIKGRLFKGSPAGTKPIPEEENLKLTDEMVYGVRVDFFRRGYNSFPVTAAKPLPIEGITKTVSV